MEKSEYFPPLLVSPACATQLRPDPGHCKPHRRGKQKWDGSRAVSSSYLPLSHLCALSSFAARSTGHGSGDHSRTQINVLVSWKEAILSLQVCIYILLRLQSPHTKIKLCFNLGFNGERHEKVQGKTKTTRKSKVGDWLFYTVFRVKCTFTKAKNSVTTWGPSNKHCWTYNL